MSDDLTRENVGPEILGALARAQGDFGKALKSEFNTFDRYKYASLVDYVDAIQKPMADNGLSFCATVAELTDLPERATKGGGTERLVRILLIGRLFHSSGQWLTGTSYAEASDRGDKAIYKAYTSGRKYLLAMMLNLAPSDLDDADQDTPRFEGKAQPAQQQKPAQQAAPPAQRQQQQPAHGQQRPAQQAPQPNPQQARAEAPSGSSNATGQPAGTASASAQPSDRFDAMGDDDLRKAADHLLYQLIQNQGGAPSPEDRWIAQLLEGIAPKPPKTIAHFFTFRDSINKLENWESHHARAMGYLRDLCRRAEATLGVRKAAPRQPSPADQIPV